MKLFLRGKKFSYSFKKHYTISCLKEKLKNKRQRKIENKRWGKYDPKKKKKEKEY